ncbi:hypothetical protein [Anditalea andensis]|uniref:Uncharacterized protein n=1 Tax=Anditalea andensis TaxID=1048983 RepID=A0A074L6C4_9BACT|nr:hypothetical protein [Anditalea andensis]KEO75388.1 hypothetical protein EL17_02285 [Anditalea andensis]
MNKKWIWKGLTYLMLVNFINLSANFYHASEMDSSLLRHHDPIDSLAELVLEYFFEMDENTIPDTETPHEKRKIADVTTLFPGGSFSYFMTQYNLNHYFFSHYENLYQNMSFDISAPPPKAISLPLL